MGAEYVDVEVVFEEVEAMKNWMGIISGMILALGFATTTANAETPVAQVRVGVYTPYTSVNVNASRGYYPQQPTCVAYPCSSVPYSSGYNTGYNSYYGGSSYYGGYYGGSSYYGGSHGGMYVMPAPVMPVPMVVPVPVLPRPLYYPYACRYGRCRRPFSVNVAWAGRFGHGSVNVNRF